MHKPLCTFNRSELVDEILKLRRHVDLLEACMESNGIGPDAISIRRLLENGEDLDEVNRIDRRSFMV